jgi:translation initiation factor IF-1
LSPKKVHLPSRQKNGKFLLNHGIDDLIKLEGAVIKVLGGGTMEIQCDNNITVRGVLSGRMKKYRIKVMVGDRVQVSVSPYDTSHGLITYRF